jgi:threonine/homoserine/homoserine lactone efflux protein
VVLPAHHGISSHEKPLHVAAGLFLIYLGLRSFWAKMSGGGGDEANPISARGWRRDFATSVLLTLTNPPTIMMFAAVFTALARAGGLNPASALATVAGVFAESLVGWCFIAALLSGLRHAIGDNAQTWTGRISRIVLAGLGVVEVGRGVPG